MARLLKASLAALFAAGALAPAAFSQASNPSDWTRPYGQAPGAETRPYAGARRASNRVVLNGIMQTGVGVSAQAQAYANANASAQVNLSGGLSGGQQGLAGPFSSANAFAVGNQLNVIVNGNYNTVVVNSRQTNNGDVSANANAAANGANAQGGQDD